MDNGNGFINHLERKLDSIIIMLNCATSEEDKQFLLQDYYTTYERYEKELIKEAKRNENNKNETQESMDWI